MGNKDALLEGATKCLLTKGYSATTARDVASEAGVSLAAIGYHYGTIRELLDEALVEMVGRFGEALGRAAAGVTASTPRARFEALWSAVLHLLPAHRRMWLLNFELLAHADQSSRLRERLESAQIEGREGLASLFFPDPGALRASERTAVGAVLQAMLLGLMAQWVVDPETAAKPRELADALIAMTRAFEPAKRPRRAKKRRANG